MPTGVPWANDVVANTEDRAVLNVINGPSEIGRPYIASRQVPVAQIEILRKAFDDTMKDRDFLEDAGKSGQPIDPMTATEVEEALRQIYAEPASAVERAGAIAR